MEIVNNILLIVTAIVSLLNLLIEIEDKKPMKHEALLKMIFGGISILSLMCTVYQLPVVLYILNIYVLTVLCFRFFVRNKILHQKSE